MKPITWINRAIESGKLSMQDLADLVPFAQRELGVHDDGKPGARTIAALKRAIKPSAVPVPPNRQAAKQLYGDPSWVKTGRGRLVDIDDKWEQENVRWFRLHTGRRVRFHKLVGHELVELFEKACTESGYTPSNGPQTYVPRVIGGTDRLSYHALAVAFDVSPRGNPWGGVQRDGSPSELRQNMAECKRAGRPSFVEIFEAAGWTWGGRWRHPKTKERNKGDDMHFQRVG